METPRRVTVGGAEWKVEVDKLVEKELPEVGAGERAGFRSSFEGGRRILTRQRSSRWHGTTGRELIEEIP